MGLKVSDQSRDQIKEVVSHVDLIKRLFVQMSNDGPRTKVKGIIVQSISYWNSNDFN